MAIIKKKEFKAMSTTALEGKLVEIRRELNTERGLIKSGGRSSNPGKIKELRRTIARILTYHSQKSALRPPKKTAAKTAATGTKSAPAMKSAPSAKPASVSKKQ